MNLPFTLARGNSSILGVHIGQNGEMNRWTQQPAFRKESDRYKAAHKLTTKKVAELLHTTLGTLNAYLYRKTAKPSLEFLQNAALVFGCSVSIFIDDPGADRPTSVDLSPYSEIDRYRFDQIVHTLDDPRLSDDDRQMLFEDFKRQANWILNLKSKKD
jgi:transcriptional regulator with XRE-family HTH domain